METLVAILTLIAVVLLYCLPGIIASIRDHHYKAAIWVTNILLGWIFIGWVAAMIWCATPTKEAKKEDNMT